jgi:S-adenosyl methyltransferase
MAHQDQTDGAALIGSLSVEASVAEPQAARRYDYLLGGKDNYAVDRQSGDELRKAFPAIAEAVRENRRFMRRAVHHLAAECGIDQFLDIGVGMPIAPNVHEVAQAVIPTARVAYVDHDPVVAVHARALLTGSTPGVRVFVPGDLRRPWSILDSPALRDTLDLQRPVGLLLIAVLHFIEDDDLAYAAVDHLVAGMPPGSFVALSHVTYDPLPPAVATRLTRMSAPGAGHGPFRARTRRQVARFLDRLEVIAPGLVSTVEWHPDRDPPAEASVAETIGYAAVARLP